MRKARTAALALIVVLGSTAGFLGLSRVFRDHPRPGFGGSGRIVFGRVQLELGPTGASSRSGPEIWSMAADGSDVRVVLAGDTSPTTPAWSPDGSRIAFLEQDPDPDDLRTLQLSSSAPDGSDLTVVAGGLIEPMFRVVAWSPDGARIAVLDSRAHDLNAFDDYGLPLTEIAIYALDGTRDRFVDVPGTASGFTWWPDGQGFAVAAMDARGDIDLVRVDLEGHVLDHLAEDVAPYPPAVSPSGDRVAFVRQEPPIEGSHVPVDDVWTVRPDGSSLTRVTDESGLKPALAWSPDGTRIVFARQTPDRCDIVSISPDGSDRTLVADRSRMGGCADEISVNGSIPPPARPEPDVVTEAGRDIGLGFNLCDVEGLGGIDFLGDGTGGRAWTGTEVLDDGTCPDAYDDRYGVAVDFTGDGVADSWSGEKMPYCIDCRPFKGVDLNLDGREDLVVILQMSSQIEYGVYTVLDGSGGARVVPVIVGKPGHEDAGFVVGEPFQFWVGSDETSYWFYCDALPVFWLTHVVWGMTTDSDTIVHETNVSMDADGIAHILEANSFKVPAETEVDLQYATTNPDCELGVDVPSARGAG